MACQASSAVQMAANATLSEVGERSQCMFARSRRGRPQQCARAASRTSSRCFGSRGSSAARSRSGTFGRGRPSAEVDLRDEVKASVVETTCTTGECATGFISSLLSNAVDDVAIELEYYSDDECPFIDGSVRDADHVLLAGEPAITEDPAENEEIWAADTEGSITKQVEACMSDNDQSGDDESCCDFNSDVCSVTSENPDEIMAEGFAKTALSDDAILNAVMFEDDEEKDEHFEFCEESPSCGHELAFVYTSQILDGAFEQSATSWQMQGDAEEEERLEFCGGEGDCVEELAFDYTSSLLDGAFVQAVTSWSTLGGTEVSPLAVDSEAVPGEPALDALKEKAKQCLLRAASQRTYDIETLKMKARESLLRAAQAKMACEEKEMEQLRLTARTALLRGLEDGRLSFAFAQVIQKTEATVEIKQSEAQEMEQLRLTAQTALLRGLEDGRLSHAFAQVMQKTEATPEMEQSMDVGAAARQVREALSKGLQSGRLSNAFDQVKQRTETTSESEQSMDVEAAKRKVREALSKAWQSGSLSNAFAEGKPQTEMTSESDQCMDAEAGKRKVREALAKGLQSGGLSNILAKLKQKTETTLENEQSRDVEAMKLKVRQAFSNGLKTGDLSSILANLKNNVEGSLKKQVTTSVVPALVTPLPLANIEKEAVTTSRTLQSPARSRRRVIGGVVRMPRTFRMDVGIESGCEDDSTLARASSLTRSYDTLGVQLYSLNDEDQLSCSEPKLSKARARLHEASMSAMSMDLESASSTSSRMPLCSPSRVSRETFSQSFAPVSLKLGQRKMRTSASLGSLTSAKVKVAPGGLLPMLAPEKRRSESIAWSMQVSRTTSKWCNTGLRGSASMIF